MGEGDERREEKGDEEENKGEVKMGKNQVDERKRKKR